MVYVDLIGPYSKSIRQHQTGGAIIKNNFSLTYMAMIDPDTGWFEIFELLMYDIGEFMGGNDEYIDKSYARVSQFFNNICLIRYLRPRKVMVEKWI